MSSTWLSRTAGGTRGVFVPPPAAETSFISKFTHYGGYGIQAGPAPTGPTTDPSYALTPRFSKGAFCLNHDSGDSFFLGGPNNGTQVMALCEYMLPGDYGTPGTPSLSAGLTFCDVHTSGNPRGQWIGTKFSRPGTNGSGDSLRGLHYIPGSPGGLLLGGYIQYDSGSGATNNVCYVPDVTNRILDYDGWHNLGSFPVKQMGRLSNWFCKVPSEWQAALLGDTLGGGTSGGDANSINLRNPFGPGVWSFDIADVTGAGHVGIDIPSVTKLMDWTSSNEEAVGGSSGSLTFGVPAGANGPPAVQYLSNGQLENADNDWDAHMVCDPTYTGYTQGYPGHGDPLSYLWSHTSYAGCGIILPGSDKLFFLGRADGFIGQIEYQNDYQAILAGDNRLYYWLFDLNDLAAVAAATKDHRNVVPIEHGVFDAAGLLPTFKSEYPKAMDYDETNNRLHICFTEASDAAGLPVIVVLDYEE